MSTEQETDPSKESTGRHGKHVSEKKEINFPGWALLSAFLVTVFGTLYVIADAYTKLCPVPSSGRCANIPMGEHMEMLSTIFLVLGVISLIAGLLASVECFVRIKGEGKAYTALFFMALTAIFAGGGIASHIIEQIVLKIT